MGGLLGLYLLMARSPLHSTFLIFCFPIKLSTVGVRRRGRSSQRSRPYDAKLPNKIAKYQALPRGFAWEVAAVYSGPPLIAFKFRHWGYFEGPFKGHAPTGEMVQFYGVGILKVDESLRAEDVEIYYDPAELFAGLFKGSAAVAKCPFNKSS